MQRLELVNFYYKKLQFLNQNIDCLIWITYNIHVIKKSSNHVFLVGQNLKRHVVFFLPFLLIPYQKLYHDEDGIQPLNSLTFCELGSVFDTFSRLLDGAGYFFAHHSKILPSYFFEAHIC